MKKKPKMKSMALSILLALAMVVGLMPGMGVTAFAADVPYASLKNTTSVINFDGKEWYLIDYDESSVTLLSRECVGASVFNPNNPDDNTYNGSKVENFVNSWYTLNISTDAKAAVNGNGMFLLTEEQARNLSTDVLKCSRASEAYDNHWWLCSKGTTNSSAAMVNGENGTVSGYSGNVWIAYGVRPALKLDLSSVIFDSESKTFTVGSAKETQTITAADVTATYGDTGKKIEASTTGDGTLSYAVKSGDAVTVNPTTGALTIVKAGSAVITVTAAETANYAQATKEVAVNINKKSVTVKANDKSIKVGEAVPDLSNPVLGKDYTVEGLVGGDALTTVPKLEYASKPDNTKPGTYEITASNASAGDNYDLSYQKGTLTISEKPAPAPEKKVSTAKAVLAAKGIAKGKTAVNLSWNKVSGADRYVIYFARCNQKGRSYVLKKVKTVNGKTLKWSKGKLAKNTAYKFYVVAQKKSGKSYKNIAKSKVGHFYTGNVKGKYTNPRSLTLKKSAYTLKKGKTATIKASVSKVKTNKKLATSHAATYRYTSNNPAVATVNAKGKVTAKAKGTAVIYVQTINGIWKTCKVTVK